MEYDRLRKGQEVVVNYRIHCDCGPNCPGVAPGHVFEYLRDGKVKSLRRDKLVVLDIDGVEHLAHSDAIVRVKRPSARAKVKS